MILAPGWSVPHRRQAPLARPTPPQLTRRCKRATTAISTQLSPSAVIPHGGHGPLRSRPLLPLPTAAGIMP